MARAPAHAQRLAAVAFAATLGLANAQALAQDTTDIDQARQELQSIESQMTVSHEKADALKKEIAAMNGDRAQQNAALIAAAQRVKMVEIETGAAEENLAKLLAEEKIIRARLDGEDTSMANLLGALERIGRNPPPALIVEPTDALGSARAAMLLADVLPQLRERAEKVSADLTRLSDLRKSAETETSTLKVNYANLFEEQLRIATLIEARKRGVTRASAEQDATEKQVQALAARADSLNQLIDSLTARTNASVNAAQTAPPRSGSLSADQIRTALANTARTAPAFDFPAGKGYLVRPAAGVAIVDFGADDGFGATASGTSIVTRADAQVVAPADGWVIYKGPYLNYGQIVIINAGQGYSILLAGLHTIDVNLGQFVLMGEPVGNMGARTIGRAVTTSAGVSRPTLYVEFRNQNKPVDPAPWWRAADAQTKNG